MDRRDFLAMSALAAASGCAAGAPPASGGSQPGRAVFPHPELEAASVAELSARLGRAELTSRALVESYLARIHAIDTQGPTLRSVLELDPDALATAAQLDDERRAKGPRSALHGIPVLIKDNIETAGATQTTAGSLALAGAPARRDAPVVQRLRAAGAVILGKANLSEWANIRSELSTSGWSARGGLTKNPHCLDRNPSGSSSGSAAAVAAGLATLAVGTETDGSIVSPASVCGIVGVKPTVGLLSGAGIIPIAHSQDTAGPMTRTVADAALLLGVMANKDYSRALDPRGARGARIGVLRPDEPWMSPKLRAVFEGALEALRRLGAVLIDPVRIAKPPELDEAELAVLLHELKADIAAYLATRPEQPLRSLEDLIRFNARHAATEMPWFGQSLFEQAARKGGLDSAEYATAMATCRRIARTDGIDLALSRDQLDAIVAPTGGAAWITDLVNGDHITGSTSTLPAVAGYPHLTVPCGFVHGLPLGVSFFGGPNQEAKLLQLGHAYEQATKHRRAPRYLPTLPIH